jgi:tRNA pseudouridine55 synthase
VACTKGTYVRTLAHQLGEKLGCGAHLATLRRVTSGKFDVQDAVLLEDLLKWDEAQLAPRVIPFLKLAAA